MNSKRIGNVGEAYALAKLVEMGIPVYQQFGDNEPADYIILIDNKLLKVQVKSSDTYCYTEPKNNQQQGINYSTNFSLCVETLHEISRQG